MTDPLLPDTTSDERAVGWGDDLDDDRWDDTPAGEVSSEERLRAERPPHHDRG